MKLDSGHKVIHGSTEENDLQKKKFLAHCNGVITLQPGGWFYPSVFQEYANEIYNFKYRPSDVIIMTFPKCGTTWMQEIIWTMRNNPNLDHPLTNTDPGIRVQFMDSDFIMACPILDPLPISLKDVEKLTGSTDISRMAINTAKIEPDPRTIKVHLPFSLLDKDLLNTAKVVFVMRNPKDVCVSYLHHHRLWKCHGFTGTNNEFVDFFLNDKVMHSPILGLCKEAWELRKHPNLCIVFYETLKANPKTECVRLNKFLGTNLTDAQIENVITHTNFANMKKRSETTTPCLADSAIYRNMQVYDSDGGIFRKGIAGDWQNKLTDAQIRKIDNWTSEHVKSLGAEFKIASMY